jgi:phage baseplate assembly protein V
MLRRAAVVAVNDAGGQQIVDVSGLASDLPKKLVRVADFGFASNPPADGEGLILCLGGRSDRAMFLGGEHQQYRPKNLPTGATAIYDAFGQILEFVQNSVKLVCTGALTITAPAGCTIDGNAIIDGGLTVTGAIDIENQGSVERPFTVNGNINLTGTLAASGDVTAGSISVQNHIHTGVERGGGSTDTASG